MSRPLESVFCKECLGEQLKPFTEVLNLFRQRIAQGGQGYVCAYCDSIEVVKSCTTCERGLCPAHCAECGRCHQPACRDHIAVINFESLW